MDRSPVVLAVVVLSVVPVLEDAAEVLLAVLVPAACRLVSKDWTSETSFDVAVSSPLEVSLIVELSLLVDGGGGGGGAAMAVVVDLVDDVSLVWDCARISCMSCHRDWLSLDVADMDIANFLSFVDLLHNRNIQEDTSRKRN